MNGLKHLLKEKKISQRDLAERMSLSKTTVNAKLNGKQGIYVSEVVIIADMLGISPQELITVLTA